MKEARRCWAEWKLKYPDKFWPEGAIFNRIHPGSRIFVGTGCGEPQYLVGALKEYVKRRPKALLNTEIVHVWTLGIAPCAEEKFKDNFRLNSFFVGPSTRSAVSKGAADYTPIFLSEVPSLFCKGAIPIDVALIQTSIPDNIGYMSLGISVDIVKSAIKAAPLVIAQANSNMPRIPGDGFLNIEEVDFLIPHDEPLLTYKSQVPESVSQKIGDYVARIIEDGSTIQVGYGSMPNAILSNLYSKKHLGVHTELFTDGIAKLMAAGVVDNSKKCIDKGKTVAAFCMGQEETYRYLDENPLVEFRSIDYTNNPLVISSIKKMIAINSALEIDLTGQATAESLSDTFYSGIGGQADFMRGAALAPRGKSILALPSTAKDGQVSRIVPALDSGAGVTLNRGDVHYVVTEYGIAYLHGKNTRERAMDLIAIAHPKFRPWLISQAKKLNLIYQDQTIIPGDRGEYPESLEVRKVSENGLDVLLRPVKISDEALLKTFFHSLSDESIYSRFFTTRKDISHQWLQDFVIVDYSKEMAILAVLEDDERKREQILGLGQYEINPGTMYNAEIAVVVKDEYQKLGIGLMLFEYLTYLAKKQGLLGFTADVHSYNYPVFRIFEAMGFEIEKNWEDGFLQMKLTF